jgi:exodeoxyribonuclease V gamma subunit
VVQLHGRCAPGSFKHARGRVASAALLPYRPGPVPSSLIVHRSNRLEALADGLAAALRAAPLPPLHAETIVVPGQGMARWLQLELAHRLGIAASLLLPFPGAFLEQLCGPGPASAAFERSVLKCRIFRLLGDARLRPRLGAAWSYCQDDPDQQKRSQLAERLATCFDDYQLWRPEALLRWEREQLHEPELPHERWQAQLWRALLREFGDAADEDRKGQGLLFGQRDRDGSHRLQRLRELLRDRERALSVLPPRLSVFGLPTLPPAFVELLQRIAEHVPVTLWLHQPTPDWYGDGARRGRIGGNAADGDTGHPLLQSWGRQGALFLRALVDADLLSADENQPFVDPGTDTLLHALQSDLLHLRTRGHTGNNGDSPRLPLADGDVSLLVHGAHSPMRELEIVRDQLLAAFDRDRTLQPGDVMVLVPDVQEYAPYVHAVFAPVQQWLPFAIADRSPASDLPLPASLLRICRIAEQRFAAPELLLLLEEPSLARTFGIARADLPVLRAWVRRAGIRWGVDGAQRQRDLALPAEEANAWTQGLERLVLGMATGPADALVLGRLPAADATAARSDLLGRFLQFFAAVRDLGTAFAGSHPLGEWAALLDGAVERLFTAVDDAEQAGRAHLQAAARRLRELQELADLREPIGAPVFRRWLEQELAARGESRAFLGGAITVAALQPMRAVPMRVLCICGLHDGSFPRRDRRDPFDLQALAPQPLDRSRQADDRQLFLDSLLAARDQLVLTYVARSSKDDSERAPSPVLSELLEHIDQSFAPPPGSERPVREHLFVQHPLQVWSPRYGAGDPRLFTFAAANSARPHAAPRAAAIPRAVVATIGAAAAPIVIGLDELLEFWRDPAKYWCRRVLELRFPLADDDGDDDVEPFRLRELDAWRLRHGAVTALLQDRPDLSTPDLARATGWLPPGPLGAVAQRDVAQTVRLLLPRVQRVLGTGRREVSVRGDGYEVRGVLDGLAPGHQVLWRAARVKGKDLLRAWICHVVRGAAAARDPSLPLRTLVLGTDRAQAFDGQLDAQSHLDRLVAGFRRGRQAPLPVFEHASMAWAKRHNENKDEPLRYARQAYEGNDWEEPYRFDLGNAWVDFCWRDRDPIADPAFVEWATNVIAPCLASAQDVEQDVEDGP